MGIPEGAELCFPQLNSSCKKPAYPDQQALLIYVVLSIVSLLTVALNLLVIISISHFRQLHTPTNILLLSLAVSDLLVGFMLMPVEIIYTDTCWFLGDMLCSLYYVVDYTITSASVASMVLISVDRYIAVCDPLRYSTKVTKRRTQICVCLCWVCSLFYRFLLLHDHLQQPGRSNSCLGECIVVIENVAGVADLVFTFIIPITIIVVLYFRVFVVSLSHARAIRSRAAATTAKHSGTVTVKKAELKAARTLGVVVVVFLFCFCPYYFPALAGQDTSVDAASVATEIWLTHFNSCVNPVIYAFFYPWFRKCIKLILTLKILKPGSCNTQIL
ncbi:trace amine-associated receptor 8c-like [Anabas testudineus]|uniref:G-protein coupled receptors family 1 profile domain-containing protein n=1 Tax=Anabas testudineus TaxID=64144 RepID=A0A7N6BC44_ANATE|nr:trace amine-associated receptor 8c-like [Anabas testudineus]